MIRWRAPQRAMSKALVHPTKQTAPHVDHLHRHLVLAGNFRDQTGFRFLGHSHDLFVHEPRRSHLRDRSESDEQGEIRRLNFRGDSPSTFRLVTHPLLEGATAKARSGPQG